MRLSRSPQLKAHADANVCWTSTQRISIDIKFNRLCKPWQWNPELHEPPRRTATRTWQHARTHLSPFKRTEPWERGSYRDLARAYTDRAGSKGYAKLGTYLYWITLWWRLEGRASGGRWRYRIYHPADRRRMVPMGEGRCWEARKATFRISASWEGREVETTTATTLHSWTSRILLVTGVLSSRGPCWDGRRSSTSSPTTLVCAGDDGTCGKGSISATRTRTRAYGLI